MGYSPGNHYNLASPPPALFVVAQPFPSSTVEGNGEGEELGNESEMNIKPFLVLYNYTAIQNYQYHISQVAIQWEISLYSFTYFCGLNVYYVLLLGRYWYSKSCRARPYSISFLVSWYIMVFNDGEVSVNYSMAQPTQWAPAILDYMKKVKLNQLCYWPLISNSDSFLVVIAYFFDVIITS